MLVVSRKTGEALQLGPNIKVKIIKIAGNRVYVGIEAPDDVRVTRVGAGDERKKSFAEAQEIKRD